MENGVKDMSEEQKSRAKKEVKKNVMRWKRKNHGGEGTRSGQEVMGEAVETLL